jgi:hypothetical protein
MAYTSGSTYPQGVLRWHHILSGAATSAAISAGLNPEIQLQRQWNDEIFDLYGIAVRYFPVVYDTNRDRIFGEDQEKTWVSAAENIDLVFEIGEEEDSWGSFGVIPQEMIVARARVSDFQSMVYWSATASGSLTGYSPRIGDVILVIYDPPLLYETIDVAPDRTTLGTFTYNNWKLVLKRWHYSHEQNMQIPTDYVPPSGCPEASAAEIEGDTIVDYDDDPSLNDDIYGKY